MSTIPNLEPHCGSWIIADNGAAVMEVFDRSFVETIASRNNPDVVIYTAAQWLAKLNDDIRASKEA